MKVQSLVDHLIAGATLQQPETYLATMPPCWSKAHEGHVVRPWVGSAGHTASPILASRTLDKAPTPP
jgi:hypothetical protein